MVLRISESSLLNEMQTVSNLKFSENLFSSQFWHVLNFHHRGKEVQFYVIFQKQTRNLENLRGIKYCHLGAMYYSVRCGTEQQLIKYCLLLPFGNCDEVVSLKFCCSTTFSLYFAHV